MRNGLNLFILFWAASIASMPSMSAAAAAPPATRLADAAAETAEQVLRRADQLEKDGKLARAADVYKEFLAAHADHTQAAEAEFRLARCLDGLGLVDEAVAHLEAVLRPANKRHEHRQDAYFLLGKLYGSLKNYPKAVQVLDAMLSEGAGLYEEEALSLCGGYYALLKKYDDAAAKFNILKRRTGSPFAEQAACKLAVLWLKAEKLDLAIGAVEDLGNLFPRNEQYRGLMVQIADLLRRQDKLDQAAALCDQIATKFAKTPEALAARCLLGQCLHDQKKFDKAAEVLDQVARSPEYRSTGLPAEAMFAAAEVWFGDLASPDKAIPRYEEAAKLAKECTSERMDKVREQCYFRLAEYYYAQKNWSVALENYQLLRAAGSQVNVLGRIIKCQNELNLDAGKNLTSAGDLAAVRKKIADNPGTLAAAEGEVFLADRELSAAMARGSQACGPIAEKFQAVLKSYPKDVLAKDSLGAYLHLQIATCYAQADGKAELAQAVGAFEKSLAADAAGVYRVNALEGLAAAADRAGDKAKSLQAYRQLFELTAGKLEAGKADADTQKAAAEYLRAMLSRAEQKDSIDEAIAMARKIVAEKSAFSDVARNAQYYVGELQFLKKDFSAAAAEFKRFVKMYGPPQDQAGDVAGAPWRPAAVDDRVLQVYDAALRVAHSWYLQGHHQNMIQAYRWIARNFPYQNKNLAEAQYWLAMELGRAADKDKAEKKRQVAEALWKNVVHPGYDFGSAGFAKRYHFWVRDPSPSVQEYVQLAALRAGQLLGEAGDHELAAGIFQEYMDLYGSPAGGGGGKRRQGQPQAQPLPQGAEENLSIARYALGRELLAMDEVTKAITCYLAYLYDLRDDRFRVAGLKTLAFHAAREKDYDLAAEAYATLLDEYGPNERDLMGRPVPVASKDRIRQAGSRVTAGGRRIAGRSGNWDGLRLPAPEGLDLGDVRHNLGYLYWKQQDWPRCVKVLAPFLEEEALRKGRSAPKALYMAAQSCFRMCDYAGGMKFLRPLLRDYPSFEAVEEAHVYAARGCVETAQWAELDHLCRRFAEAWPQSSHRPHMDLYAALALAAQGKADDGLARLKGLAAADTLEDVKADASYHVGRLMLADEKAANYAEAMRYLDQSVALYPREPALLAAARCAMKLRQPEKAKAALDRLLREFAGGDPKVVAEAKALLGEVNKQIPPKG